MVSLKFQLQFGSVSTKSLVQNPDSEFERGGSGGGGRGVVEGGGGGGGGRWTLAGGVVGVSLLMILFLPTSCFAI